MMTRHPGLMLILLLLPFLAAGLFVPQTAQAAVSCQVTSGNTLNFGTVDPTEHNNHTAETTIGANCSNTGFTSQWVGLCVNIGDGSWGLDQNRNRQLVGPGGIKLPFQLYQGPSHQVIWGGENSAWPNNVVYLPPIHMPADSSSNYISFTVYGVLFGPITNAVYGFYSDGFTSNSKITGSLSQTKPSPPYSCSKFFSYLGSFEAQAQIAKAGCHVDASDMSFGSFALLNSTVNATASLSLTCLAGTAYNVGLSNGQHYANGFRRMTDGSGHYVEYQLYRNSSRTEIWGNTIGTNTVAGTGNGSTRNLTVYGRVPAQATPPAGNYSDTIAVTVTY